jgi:thiamine biosynthesis protein ThiI
VVVHYHEVALKRGNRSMFVRQLVDNIGAALRGTGVKGIGARRSAIVVRLKTEADRDEIARRLRWLPGIANFSFSRRSERDIDDVVAAALAAAGEQSFASFAVRPTRADKSFSLTSPEIGEIVGRAVQKQTGAAVDLRTPEVVIRVEVLSREVFVSTDRRPGPGGLPVGTGGTVVALLSGGIDSPVAAYRMMRRGCRVEFIHFHGAPYQDRTSREKTAELASLLTRCQLRSNLHQVAFGDIQRRIVASVRRPVRVVLYRRMMMRIAETLARSLNAGALVTGESLGQVASQTLANIAVVEQAASLPVLRPLVGMDKAEITAEAERLGTFEISIRPDQDCCQLFVPKHPATAMSVEEAIEAEQSLDIPEMVQSAIAGIVTEHFVFPESQPTATPGDRLQGRANRPAQAESG